MTDNTLVPQDKDFAAIEQVLISGDLSKLTPEQRVFYYNRVCDSLGLNPLTKPFDYINLNGKLRLYPLKDCTDQLRKSQNVSVAINSAKSIDAGVYVVHAKATLANGRSDESTGAVSIAGLKGEALANAVMKAETKAKRRATLSICGLGWLDETEVEQFQPERSRASALPDASEPASRAAVDAGNPLPRITDFDPATGEITFDDDNYSSAVNLLKSSADLKVFTENCNAIKSQQSGYTPQQWAKLQEVKLIEERRLKSEAKRFMESA